MVEIVSVPFDLCGPHHGSRLGPLAMLLDGLLPELRDLGLEAMVSDVALVDGRLPGTREECDVQGLEVFRKTKTKVHESIGAGRTPLVIGGDHSISIGSIGGALAGLGNGLAVLWIDAHMDVNTPDTSPSGNLHGMALGALARLQPGPRGSGSSAGEPWESAAYDLWPRLLEVVPEPGIGKDRIGWMGLREVDPGEIRNLGSLSGSLVATMQDIDEQGALSVVRGIDRWLRETGAMHLWISFDVDVLDPFYAPGTGTAVRGGLTYREGHLIAESLHSLMVSPNCPYRLAGVDIVEVNPMRDRGNETAAIAVEWVCSLFGKTILHGLKGTVQGGKS